jgi:hypothetical protein
MSKGQAASALLDAETRAGSNAKQASARRDWILLPLMAILPLIVLVAFTEFIARQTFIESPPTSHPCLVLNDASTGVRAIPNSVCMQKTLESGWVEFRFNGSGHRAVMEALPKPPGVYRIVLIGSSLSEGWTVPREKSFAALLPGMLSKDTGHDIDLYNEGMEWGSPHSTDLRFNQVLEAKPDLILWPVTPWDIYNVSMTVPYPTNAESSSTHKPGEGGTRAGPLHRLWAKLTMAKLTDFLSHNSKAFFMLQHWLYKSDSIYLGRSLSVTDEWTPSLQDRPSAEWQEKLRQFDGYTADMMARAKAAGVPFVVMALPRHAQAVMIASGDWPADLNPYSFGNQLKPIVEKNGGVYIDILPAFRNIPNIHSDFYPVDPHLDIAGHAAAATVLEKGLTGGAIPALSAQSPAAGTAQGAK